MKVELLIKVLGLLLFAALVAGCEGETLTLEAFTSPLGTSSLSPPIATPGPMKSPIRPTPTPTRGKAETSPTAPASPIETPQPRLTRTPTPLRQGTPPIETRPTRPPQAQDAVEAARAFLANHLKVPVVQIQLLYVEPQTWPDTSLGCPKPGKDYAQVVTSGYRVVLQVGTRQYEVHTDRSAKHVVLCPGPVPGERVPLARAITQEAIVAAARQHLAERLGVPLEEVEVVSVEEAMWEDETLGCPRPPGNYPDRAYPGPSPGYRIVLAAGGVDYEYHSGRLWLIFCGEVSE
ncbi:MAG: hypothetical protein ACOC7N_03765 [Chloroflexota bacterium]